LVTDTLCDVGSPPPAVAVNDAVDGVTTMLGGGAATVNVTVTLCGLLAATADVTGTVAV
jgi:hypothetical protein